MTWVRMEDGYPINRKVAALSDAAFRLDFEAICWSNRELADGQVRARELTQIRSKATRKHAAELVSVGRWHPAGATCSSEKCPANPASPSPATSQEGWVIHDYFDQQPTRVKVLADRAAKAERQRNWMAKRRTTDTSTGPPTDTSSGAASGRVTGTHPAPAPAPAPEGKREGDLPEAPAARRTAADAADGEWSEQPVATNGHTPVRPPDTSALRATLAAARRKAHHPGRADPLEELREATPDIPPLLEPTEEADPDAY